MATYAIGDVQGCMSALSRLVDQIHFDPATDKLWFVGDLVNRGPDSLGILRYVRGLGHAAITVLGNHDLHLMAIAEGITPPRRKDTLQQVLTAMDRDTLLAWLRQQRLLYQENGFVLVHAGLLPQWTVPQAARLAQEVEQALQGEEGYTGFLRSLYGEKLPDRWSNDLRGITRLGVIANAMTKLRVCTEEGQMDLSFKAEPETATPGLIPWFQVPKRQSADATVICGHWSALGLRLQDNLIALDTGCVWGRTLAAVRLEDRQVFQVNCSC
jgi:bis(5'-nucleosyl)-tetraphosphatase (symmetrical)